MTHPYQAFDGVHPILPTPFTEQGELDLPSLERLVNHIANVGGHGVAVLGFLGEAHKLANWERKEVVTTAVKVAAERNLKVFVGVRAFGAAGAIEQALEAKELGADATFVAPIGVQNDQVLYNFYKSVAEESGLPLLIHDYPDSFGTKLSANLIAKLGNEVEGIIGSKLEDMPLMVKISNVLDQAPNFSIFGGYGGKYFLEELQRGARGIMTGFAYSDVLVKIYNAFNNEGEDAAAKIFDAYTPLLRYEFQPVIGLAFRKYIFKRQGLFTSDFVREPGNSIDPRSAKELEGIIKRVGLNLDPVI